VPKALAGDPLPDPTPVRSFLGQKCKRKGPIYRPETFPSTRAPPPGAPMKTEEDKDLRRKEEERFHPERKSNPERVSQGRNTRLKRPLQAKTGSGSSGQEGTRMLSSFLQKVSQQEGELKTAPAAARGEDQEIPGGGTPSDCESRTSTKKKKKGLPLKKPAQTPTIVKGRRCRHNETGKRGSFRTIPKKVSKGKHGRHRGAMRMARRPRGKNPQI